VTGRLVKQGTELEGLCPFHSERNASFYVNLETGVWICHKGCGSGNFMQLMDRLKIQGVMPVAAGRKARVGTTVDMGLEPLMKRGFSPEMLESWKIVWNKDVGGAEFPVWDTAQKFVGYLWRMPEGVHPKYRHMSQLPKSRILFGANRLQDRKEVILCEGPLDAMWVQEVGGAGVAMLGAMLAEDQVRLLSSWGTKKVVLCLDNDAAGRAATEIATRQLRAAGFWVFRTELPSGRKDIQEVPLSQVAVVLKRRHLCLNGAGLIHHRYRRWLDNAARAPDTSTWKY
jgi:DNA primase